MNIELKQAAQRALLALRNSQPHPSNPFIGLTDKDFIDHEETIRQLRNALQQAAHTTQAVPMTDTQLCEALGIDGSDDWTYQVRDAVEAHHGIIAQDKKETP